MSVTALAGAAVAKCPVPAPEGQSGVRTRLPLRVKIDTVDLGGWQTCTGLKVEFKSRRSRRAATTSPEQFLPDKVVYSKVTLKRAVEKNDSKKVQQWLNRSARKWLAGETSPARTT